MFQTLPLFQINFWQSISRSYKIGTWSSHNRQCDKVQKFISDLILWHSGRFPWWISITSRICQIVASFILISIISNSTVFYKIHINRFRLGKDYFYIKNCAYCEIIWGTIMLLMEICSGSIAYRPYLISYIGWGQNNCLIENLRLDLTESLVDIALIILGLTFME